VFHSYDKFDFSGSCIFLPSNISINYTLHWNGSWTIKLQCPGKTVDIETTYNPNRKWSNFHCTGKIHLLVASQFYNYVEKFLDMNDTPPLSSGMSTITNFTKTTENSMKATKIYNNSTTATTDSPLYWIVTPAVAGVIFVLLTTSCTIILLFSFISK